MKIDLKFVAIAIVILVVGVIAGGIGKSSQYMGGLIHNVQESFDAGIANQGIEIINSLGVFVGAISGTTLTMAGETNLDSMIQGGDVTTLTGGTATTTTMTAANICDSSVIQWLGDNSFGV
ncbi:MAG: hypothetical protein QQN41_13035, partial [Nitrosopumilus sp.]